VSKVVYGLTKNGIKEKCQWDAVEEKRICPRHYIHINNAKARVSDHVVWEDESSDVVNEVVEYQSKPEYKEESVNLSWEAMTKIPHAEELFYVGRNSGTIEVRHVGNLYQIKTVRTIDISGAAGDALVKMAAVSADMDDAEVSNTTEATGGGQGHYSYGTVTRITGWVTMTSEQIASFKTMQYNNKQTAKVEREIKKLNKMAEDMKKRII
jgi:hypothetical protein